MSVTRQIFVVSVGIQCEGTSPIAALSTEDAALNYAQNLPFDVLDPSYQYASVDEVTLDSVPRPPRHVWHSK